MERENEVPERVRDYLSGIEERYQSLLDQRCELMKKAIEDLKKRTAESADLPFTVVGYEVAHGKNLSQFTILLGEGGAAVVFCYPEELHDAEIIMPFRVPGEFDFTKHKIRFMDHFGYEELEIDVKQSGQPGGPAEDMALFSAKLGQQRLSVSYLLAWILQSILFQEQGEAFLRGQPYLKVNINDDGDASLHA